MLTLGSAIRRLRSAGGLTQKQLAERLSVNSSYISHLEADRKEPSLELLRNLAQSLDVPPGVLLAILLWVELPAEDRDLYEPIFESLVALAEVQEAA
jgi:transcriptional regulator with XRE-family HTH domain